MLATSFAEFESKISELESSVRFHEDREQQLEAEVRDTEERVRTGTFKRILKVHMQNYICTLVM